MTVARAIPARLSRRGPAKGQVSLRIERAPSTLQVQLAADPLSVPGARRFVVDALTAWGDGRYVDDAELVASELTSGRSISHGMTQPPPEHETAADDYQAWRDLRDVLEERDAEWRAEEHDSDDDLKRSRLEGLGDGGRARQTRPCLACDSDDQDV